MEFYNRNYFLNQPKFQELGEIINITDWVQNTAYSEGARDKFETFCPEVAPHTFLIPHHRYLFKQSDRKYPGDFLVEILAYRIGVRMGVPVAPVFIAIDDNKRVAGALSEWFYSYPGLQMEEFELGGDILQRVINNYDRKRGTQHNLTDIIQTLMQYAKNGELAKDVGVNGIKILIFDALIGNGDRHQDNWGIVLCKNGRFLSPAFDNGSSMGHEILESRLSTIDIEAYIRRGKHHLKINRDDKREAKHLDLIQYVLSLSPEAKDILRGCLDFDLSDIKSDMLLLKQIQDALPYNDNWLTEARLNFMSSLFVRRYELLKEMLN